MVAIRLDANQFCAQTSVLADVPDRATALQAVKSFARPLPRATEDLRLWLGAMSDPVGLKNSVQADAVPFEESGSRCSSSRADLVVPDNSGMLHQRIRTSRCDHG